MREIQRNRNRALVVLGCMVAIATSLALMVPAITLTTDSALQVGTVLNEQTEASDQEASGEEAAISEDSAANAAAAAENPLEGEAAVTAGSVDASSEDAAMPAQSFSADLKDAKGNVVLTVAVEAPEGAFPAGTTMKIDGVDSDVIQGAVDEAIAKKTDAWITRTQAVDITFHDAEGGEIEPQREITVKFASELIAGSEDSLVVHVDDNGGADVVEPLTKGELTQRGLQSGADELFVDVDAFSTYVLVGITIEDTVLASDGNNYRVVASYGPESGIPVDAVLSVEEIPDTSEQYAEYVSKTEAALGMEAGGAGYIRLFDIKIVDKDDATVKYQPVEGVAVNVNIELADAKSDALSVVHFADGAQDGQVIDDVAVDGENVFFQADGFSIYAVVDEGGTDENARIGYRFWYNDGSQNVLLSTQYFRYKDVHPEGGASQLTLNEPSIPEIDAATWNRIFRGWSKTSFNDDDANLMTVDVLNAELSAYTDDQFVEGTFVDVYANLKDVYYVTYVDVNPNNVLATDMVPKAETGATTYDVKPETELRPTIDSDTELIGWYDINNPETVYDPGQEGVVLESNITLYPKIKGGSWLIFNDNDMVDDGTGNMVSGGASFTPPAFYLGEVTRQPDNPTWAGYRFDGWYTTPDCSTPFTFGETLAGDTTVYAKWTPSDSAYRVIIWKQRASDDANAPDAEKTYDYVTSYLFDEGVVTGQTVSLDASYKNIYGPNGSSGDTDKAYFVYNADNTDQSVVVKADGSSVLNVRYDRKPVTLNFYTWDYTYTESSSTTSGYYYLPDGNGGYNQTYLYYNAGKWYRTRTNTGTWLNPRYSYSDEYTGARYTRSNNRSWLLYKSFTGLYGSTLKENGYSWPEEYNWYSTGNSRGAVGGTRTTFMSSFLPSDVDTTGSTITVDFYGSSSSGNARVHFLTQNEDGAYTERDTITTSGGSFYISDKYIGYHASTYSTNNQIWESVGTKNSSGYYNNGDPVSYTNNLYIRFDRNDHTLAFYTNNSANQLIDYTMPYGTSLSDYADQNPGQHAGYYFNGWFADPGCTEPFDFSQTMPDNNIAVYGKWRMERIRVVIDPGASNVYMGSQGSTFRLDYDERIDGGLLETATRAGYILDGWYTDPDFTNRFLFSSPVNSETPGVDMSYHTSPTWAAARAAYGDEGEAYENVRGILHLYAKWIPDPNSKGVNIIYDPGEAAIVDSLGNALTTVPIDTHMYGFDGTSTARETPSNYNDLFTFKFWQATKKDGTTVNIYPGDPVELAHMALTDPIYDESGQELLRGTVILRAIYDMTGDPSRITHITYDGNTFEAPVYGTQESQTLRGQTRDGTHRYSVTHEEEINQTITLPTADDFYLDGWELAGWAFTPGTYEGQTTGEGHYDTTFVPGQQVAADNLVKDSVNNQGNTLFAMWKPKKYSVTVRQVVENGVPNNSFTYDYKTGVENAIASAPNHSETLTGNSSFEVDDLEYYDRVGHVIRIATPTIPSGAVYDVRVNAVVTKDDGTTETLNPTPAGDYQILGDVTITYTYSLKVPVKLQKRNAANHNEALTGAQFTLTPVEYNSTTQRWEDVGSSETIVINANEITKYLQEGTYRIVEESAPDNYAKLETELFLTVKQDGSSTLFLASGGSVDEDVAVLDAGNKTLTIFDNPIRTVTLSKEADDESQSDFTFTVTVFNNDNNRLRVYEIGTHRGAALVTNNIGEVTLPLKHEESVQLKIPHGCMLTVEEAANSLYNASYSYNNEESVNSRVFDENGVPVAITEDSTLAYTNNLVTVPVTLKKVGVNSADQDATETPLAGATFTFYDADTGGQIINDPDGHPLMNKTSDADGVFFVGNLKIGTYYLEETTVPAGYYAPLGRFKLEISSTNAAPTITSSWVSGSPDGSVGQVTGDAESRYTITIRNVTGPALPSTGGSGTSLVYLFGAILVVLGVAGLAIRVRYKSLGIDKA